MRQLTYKLLPAVGPGSWKTSGSLADLVRDIPHLISHDLIPPLRVLNEVLRSGDGDAGMSGGCRWKPFTIDQAEYDELVLRLKNTSGGRYATTPVPEWVRTRSDWNIFLSWRYGCI